MKLVKKAIPAWAAILFVLLATGTTGVALTVTPVTGNLLSLFSATNGASAFTVTGYTVAFPSVNNMTVTLTLTNGGGAAHTTDATIFIHNAGGATLANATLPSGSVAGGATGTVTFVFPVANIAANYTSSFIELSDTS